MSVLTVKAAPADVTSDLMQAREVVKMPTESFYTERLEANIKPFHDKIPSNKSQDVLYTQQKEV